MKIGVEWAVSLIFIMICTITDIRKREIPLTMIILFSCLSLVIAKIRGEEGGWFSFLYSMAPGVFFLLLSFCTRQSIGYGDGLFIRWLQEVHNDCCNRVSSFFGICVSVIGLPKGKRKEQDSFCSLSCHWMGGGLCCAKRNVNGQKGILP